MEAKQTPAPWSVIEHSWATTGIYAGEVRIAVLDIKAEATEDTQIDLEEQMRANAAFIVRAVNAHDELLAALKLTLAELEAYELPRDPLHPQRAAVEAARAAIATAAA